MEPLQIVKDLCEFSPRQGQNEQKTAKYLTAFLANRNINFSIQNFPTKVPIIKSTLLKINGQEVPALGSCMHTGSITSVEQIRFDTHSDYISTHSMTQDPSVYISRLNSHLLSPTAKVDGRVEVEEYSFQAANILVGNTQDPQNIIFAHYDCLGGGAIDNAGGVALCLSLLSENRDLTSENLFVFVGNEELSYDEPNYWGYGYRQFEQKYPDLLKKTKQLIVVDGVGLTSPLEPPEFSDDPENFFPIKDFTKYLNKTKIISSDQQQVLKCYHCIEDTPDKLHPEYLNQSHLVLTKMLS